jgi:sugar phosphate permease
MHWPMQSKYVKNWFPPAERGKANSVWIFGLFIGPALAMPFFTWIIQGMGWRMSFFILVLIGLIPLSLIWFITKDHPSDHPRVNKLELDYIESGLADETAAEVQTEKSGVWENMKLFMFNYRFWLITAFYFCNASVWWGTMAWLPSYLKVARDFSWGAMGAMSSLPYVLGAIAVLAFGYLSDRVGRRAPFAAISMFGAALGIYFGAHAPDNMTAAILISLGIASLGLGLPSTWSLLQQVVPGKTIGAGAGMMNGIANGGAALAPIVIGSLIASSGGSYVAGLMYLVTLGVVGGLCMCILAYQKY